jgi:lipopolysaccharide transport system ATP-binding protein
MSPRNAIEVRDLGKEYVLGEQVSFPTLRDALVRRPGRSKRERLWALRDATFEIPVGAAVGVIGHNGAGKTTLLKLISRITGPTTGEVKITGHVGSLLEVGTGFHPELTGRDNVYLNGAILGMRRREIQRKFDEIVDFAGVERFIDTPVKRYSSGMYVRLAFAVAAHLEPDILIVDEVLAVGDATFQKKCLGKLGEVSEEGRTVLFVTHNTAAVRTLTQQTIWLDHGSVIEIGPTRDVVNNYLESLIVGHDATAVVDLADEAHRRSVTKAMSRQLTFESISMLGPTGTPTTWLAENGTIRLELGFAVHERVRYVELVARVKSMDGLRLFSSFSGHTDEYVHPGRYRAQCLFPDVPLRPAPYTIELFARTGSQIQDIVPSALRFEVQAGHFEVDNPAFAMRADGFIRVPSEWTPLEPVDAAVTVQAAVVPR